MPPLGGPPFWLPDLPGLAFWGVGSQGVYQDTNATIPARVLGDPVRAWTDAAGGSLRAVSAQAASYGPSQVNGWDAVSFTSTFLEIFGLAATGTLIVYVVIKVMTGPGTTPTEIAGEIGNLTLGIRETINEPNEWALKLDGAESDFLLVDNTTALVKFGRVVSSGAGNSPMPGQIFPLELFPSEAFSTNLSSGGGGGGNGLFSYRANPDHVVGSGSNLVTNFSFGATIPGTLGNPIALSIAEIAIFQQDTTGLNDLKIKNYFTSKYTRSAYLDILLAAQTMIAGASPFTVNNTFLSLFDEPFPLMGGPMAVIMPGSGQADDGQFWGGGRSTSGVDANFTVRVIDQSLRDLAYQGTLKYTDANVQAPGIYRSVRAIVNALQTEFPFGLAGELLSEEPFLAESQEIVPDYAQAPSWGAVDLTFTFKYPQRFITNTITRSTYNTINPTNLADMLIGIQSLILNLGVFPSIYTESISIVEQPPLYSSYPMAVIIPGRFRRIEGHVRGGARAVTTWRGTVAVHTIVRNLADLDQESTQLLTQRDNGVGLMAASQGVIEALQEAFPVDPSGNLLTIEPLAFLSFGRPRPYGYTRGVAGMTVVFQASYHESLT